MMHHDLQQAAVAAAMGGWMGFGPPSSDEWLGSKAARTPKGQQLIQEFLADDANDVQRTAGGWVTSGRGTGASHTRPLPAAAAAAAAAAKGRPTHLLRKSLSIAAGAGRRPHHSGVAAAYASEDFAQEAPNYMQPIHHVQRSMLDADACDLSASLARPFTAPPAMPAMAGRTAGTSPTNPRVAQQQAAAAAAAATTACSPVAMPTSPYLAAHRPHVSDVYTGQVTLLLQHLGSPAVSAHQSKGCPPPPVRPAPPRQRPNGRLLPQHDGFAAQAAARARNGRGRRPLLLLRNKQPAATAAAAAVPSEPAGGGARQWPAVDRAGQRTSECRLQRPQRQQRGRQTTRQARRAHSYSGSGGCRQI